MRAVDIEAQKALEEAAETARLLEEEAKAHAAKAKKHARHIKKCVGKLCGKAKKK